ncbi:hypothetical protein ACH5RR_032659 [Cinchona calisaya]|uniref:Uncharacterized protein n=1 Tax=Cinchona calisaya TaxID=153742 RepID=A0ABD2YLV6_9GENT
MIEMLHYLSRRMTQIEAMQRAMMVHLGIDTISFALIVPHGGLVFNDGGYVGPSAIVGQPETDDKSNPQDKAKQPEEVVLVAETKPPLAEERPTTAPLSKKIQFETPHNQGIGSTILYPTEIQNPNPTKMGKDLVVPITNVEGLNNSNF